MEQFKLDKVELIALLERIDKGFIKLPSFQRDYKWKPSQVKKLLDSIQKRHPAGSLLFLEVDSRKKLIAEEPFKYPSVTEGETEDLVLDGQQRLTSCYCVFFNKGTKSYYINLVQLFNDTKNIQNVQNIDFEKYILDRKIEFYPDQQLGQHRLPMSFLKSKEILRQKLYSYKQNLRESGHDSDYINFIDFKLENFLDSFFDYKFPVISLPKSLSLEAVCKVFQSLNTTGLKLSAFDICVAKFMSLGINLKDKIQESCEQYPELKQVFDADETIVLQTIALLVGETPKKNKLADTLKSNHISDWNRAIEGLKMATDMLNDFGVGCDKDLSLLPYQPILPVVAATLADREYSTKNMVEKSNIQNKVRKWFYTVGLKVRYTEGTDNKMQEDYKNLLSWIINQTPLDYMSEVIRWNPSQLLKINKSGAIGKTILCALNSHQAEDFYNFKKVGVGTNLAQSQLHHTFPFAKYKQANGELINSIFNFTFLTNEANNYIRDKGTREYITKIMTDKQITEGQVKSILSKHLIDENCYSFLLNEDYAGFINQRLLNYAKFFNEHIGLNIIIDNDYEIDEDEIE